MDQTLQAVGQNSSTFFYPAATDEELADTDLLITNYRRSMGMTRIIALVGAGVAALWMLEYIRFGPRRKS